MWPGIMVIADKTVIANDGTDDSYLLISIIDAHGKELSNSPVVKLSIVSGPGEFPTGTSITFDPKSDIEIIDGLAATEFRSYFGGETVIRATSPGLTDVLIKIKTNGLPIFLDGKTPVVADRPYIRFTGKETKASISIFGIDNPTSASSQAAGRLPRLGGDANPYSFWQAANTDLGNWWQVDLERFVDIKQVKLTFPDAANYGYKIEAMVGENTWKVVADASETTSTDKVRLENIAPNTTTRFLRITYAKLPAGKAAALAEIEVFGELSK